MGHFPWVVLNTKTLRTVVQDLGLERYVGRPHRRKLEELLNSVERDGLESVLQGLQERAERRASPELEYAGPPVSAMSLNMHMDVDVYPVVEITSRAGPSTRRARVPPSTSSASGSSVSAHRKKKRGVNEGEEEDAEERTATKKRKGRIPPPSYAVLYQLEQEVSEPSLAPIPLLHPDLRFEGVVLPLVRHRELRDKDDEEGDNDSDVVERRPSRKSVPGARSLGTKMGMGAVSAPPMRLEAVELTTSVRRRG
ncbi:hypothetical protein C2E23DRAFT_888513 [Lenzites betulinus]|nr:hypothetical protein C2E23DRAFT_888513 [Lenzites betulinus]